MAVAGFVSRVFLSAVFLYSGTTKLTDRDPFEHTLQEVMDAIGLNLRWAVARQATLVFATVETALGCLLLSGREPLAATLATIALLALFVSVSAIAGRSGRDISCNCFGSSDSHLGWETTGRAVVLAIPAAIYYASVEGTGSVWWPPSVSFASSAAGLIVAAVLLFLWLSNITLIGQSVRERRLLTETASREIHDSNESAVLTPPPAFRRDDP
ncbi:MAG: DoxX family membrane protein [Actinobacteria bacterium]|nr:DoxX family membrane protein [Actinomycetota bacterium]